MYYYHNHRIKKNVTCLSYYVFWDTLICFNVQRYIDWSFPPIFVSEFIQDLPTFINDSIC